MQIIPAQTGTGQGIVAGTNAPAVTRRFADFQADGTNDDLDVDACLDAFGRCIIVGTLVFSNSVTRITTGCEIRGWGPNQSVIQRASGMTDPLFVIGDSSAHLDDGVISGIKFDGNGQGDTNPLLHMKSTRYWHVADGASPDVLGAGNFSDAGFTP